MLKFINKWLDVYEDEIGLFLWSALLLFLIRSSNILFNNFAETAFLKRFGVEYLPMVYMANSLVTFFIMGLMTGIIGRLPGGRVLSYMLLFCGASVAGLRFVIPLGIDYLYPVFFILKSQYEVLLGLFFWNLANDLFNTRQSKRLFPLITAGGVLGGIIGSFATPWLAKAISLDNLLFAYFGTTMVGALAVKRMGMQFPTLLVVEKKGKKVKSRSSALDEFKKVWPMIKESRLVQILILLTLIPNIVIPIMNYQFNFAIDQTFATETGMIRFFGYFRGVMNIISLIILLFVGKIYGRWGLPVALMFHPFNYVLAFAAFLLRFDIFSAMYARISTNVLRTTINNPARAVLVGLVPPAYRNVVRPFLRGTIVRLGILIGSGFIMLSEGLLHPRYLSVVGIVFVGVWAFATLWLKRGYSNILLDLISKNMLDMKSLEEKDLGQVFTDKEVKNQLIHAFSGARGADCLWYGELLKSLGLQDLDSHILSKLDTADDKTKIELLSLLSPEAGEEAVQAFGKIAVSANPQVLTAVIKAANRLSAEISLDFLRSVYEATPIAEVKAYAVAGLMREAPEKYQDVIDGWLDSSNLSEKRAGIVAAGESGNKAYVSKLKEILEGGSEDALISPVLHSLHQLGAEDMNAIARPYLAYPHGKIRKVALETFDIHDDDSLRTVIERMNDSSESVHELAKEKLRSSSYQNPQLLIESLAVPRRKVREGIFYLLEFLNIGDVEVYRFVRSLLERSYRNLAESEALSVIPKSRERDLLKDHLDQRKMVNLENTLRILATQDRTGQMRIIWRGLSSSDQRQRSNSVEALDDTLEPSLSKLMIPLLENYSPPQCLRIGKKQFSLPSFDTKSAVLFNHLLTKKDWVTVTLTLYLIRAHGLEGVDENVIKALEESENAYIRQTAQGLSLHPPESGLKDKEGQMASEISIPDKVLHLKGIQIFEGLSVSELAAIASVTEEETYAPGETVIKEGDPGDTMYLIVQGEVSVIKSLEENQEMELDKIRAGDYFGEMALFEDTVRSASIRTVEESRFLVLHKREFTEIVREYPQIALHICTVLSRRIRELHQKVQSA